MKISFHNRVFLLLCILGSVVRLWYGYYYQPWTLSPDHQAWNIVIENGNFSYSNLIHYPHEGGTILISLLAKFIHLFASINALLITTVLLDFVVRLIQIGICFRLTSFSTTLFFGIWTIFAIPSLLPWGSVNFGLHYLSSVFPFIALYFAARLKRNHLNSIFLGMGLGLFCWFSYLNFFLLIIPLVLMLQKEKSGINHLKFWGSFLMVMAVQLLVKSTMDAGFHLEETTIFSIRDLDFYGNFEFKRLYEVWVNPLANSLVSSYQDHHKWEWVKYIWLAILLAGLLMFLLLSNKTENTRTIRLASFFLVLLFMAVYALSPLYFNGSEYGGSTIGNYVSYRHLSYILPLMMMLCLKGLMQTKTTYFFIPLILIISASFTLGMFFKPVQSSTDDKAIGWVLGNKFGHDPATFNRLAGASELNHVELYNGLGWSISSSFFRNNDASDKEIEESIDDLSNLINSYPDSVQKEILKGVELSFGSKGTQRYPSSIYEKIRQQLESEKTDVNSKF